MTPYACYVCKSTHIDGFGCAGPAISRAKLTRRARFCHLTRDQQVYWQDDEQAHTRIGHPSDLAGMLRMLAAFRARRGKDDAAVTAPVKRRATRPRPEPVRIPVASPDHAAMTCACGKRFRIVGDGTIGATYHATWTRKGGKYGPDGPHFIPAIGGE